MDKCKIYILAHKPVEYGIPEDSVLTPLQVGDNEAFLKLRDDTGDNISALNPLYAETTGTYWVWKNAPRTKYVGIMQYRRRFPYDENTDFEGIFNEYEVVAPKPLEFPSVRYQYSISHCGGDIDLLQQIINDRYPQLKGKVKEILDSNKLYYANSFIMKYEDFNEYCKFIFDILGEYRKRKGWENSDMALEDINEEMLMGKRNGTRGLRYQGQVLGFLAERLLTIFLITHFKKIKEEPFVLMEGQGI